MDDTLLFYWQALPLKICTRRLRVVVDYIMHRSTERRFHSVYITWTAFCIEQEHLNFHTAHSSIDRY